MEELEFLKAENQRLSQELNKKLFELSIWQDITNKIDYSFNYNDLLDSLMDSLHKIIDYDFCASLFILEEDKKAKMIIRIARPVPRCAVEALKLKVISALSALRGSVIQPRDIEYEIKGDIIEEEGAQKCAIQSSFDVPLFVQDAAVGALSVASIKNISYSDDDTRLFYTLVSQVSSTIEKLQIVLAG
ncbi:MAG: GAF domain-containing protein, partial [Candidatus Omnitrophica bacterium]|nr:GAF domain-containing protein [Candidatus Omnitrophota bacterium]